MVPPVPPVEVPPDPLPLAPPDPAVLDPPDPLPPPLPEAPAVALPALPSGGSLPEVNASPPQASSVAARSTGHARMVMSTD
jgi:hypothetical protein